MLGDRRRINRLLKPDRRKSADRRGTRFFPRDQRNTQESENKEASMDRRVKLRRFSDRVKPK